MGTAALAAEESPEGLTAEVGPPQPPQQDLHLRVNVHPSVCHRHAMSTALPWWPWNTKELSCWKSGRLTIHPHHPVWILEN